jgi:hypothetical protein
MINPNNMLSMNETLPEDSKVGTLPDMPEEEEPLSATEIEEDKIISRIMQVL